MTFIPLAKFRWRKAFAWGDAAPCGCLVLQQAYRKPDSDVIEWRDVPIEK